MKPIVSVIIPAYNCKKYIRECIESVLRQDIACEILIIDDASPEKFIDEIEDLLLFNQIYYLRNDYNMGVAESRNIGIKLSKGKYIAFLDSDDIWADDKLIKQLIKLEKTNGELCYTARQLINKDGNLVNKIIEVEEICTYKTLQKHNVITCSSVLLKREVALEFPMAHDDCHEDYFTWLCILRKYKVCYGINEPLVYYRLTPNGKSRNRIKSVIMTYKVHRYLNDSRRGSLYNTVAHMFHGINKYWL